jgi:hypothetical protein
VLTSWLFKCCRSSSSFYEDRSGRSSTVGSALIAPMVVVNWGMIVKKHDRAVAIRKRAKSILYLAIGVGCGPGDFMLSHWAATNRPTYVENQRSAVTSALDRCGFFGLLFGRFLVDSWSFFCLFFVGDNKPSIIGLRRTAAALVYISSPFMIKVATLLLCNLLRCPLLRSRDPATALRFTMPSTTTARVDI